jgi:hypothetical protein
MRWRLLRLLYGTASAIRHCVCYTALRLLYGTASAIRHCVSYTVLRLLYGTASATALGVRASTAAATELTKSTAAAKTVLR